MDRYSGLQSKEGEAYSEVMRRVVKARGGGLIRA